MSRKGDREVISGYYADKKIAGNPPDKRRREYNRRLSNTCLNLAFRAASREPAIFSALKVASTEGRDGMICLYNFKEYLFKHFSFGLTDLRERVNLFRQ